MSLFANATKPFSSHCPVCLLPLDNRCKKCKQKTVSLRHYQSYIITIPIRALSINSFIRSGFRRTYITKKGRAYQKAIIEAIENQPVYEKMTGRIEIFIFVNLKGYREFDGANAEKPLTDCFQGLIFENDKQIDRTIIMRNYNAAKDTITIFLNEFRY